MAGRLCTIETTDDRENEITLLQSSMESLYKNNCKERKHLPRKGAHWWYPELAKMRTQCRHNVRRAHRHQIDWDTVKTGRREYKKAIRRCKQESWSRFCSSVEGPRAAARLYRARQLRYVECSQFFQNSKSQTASVIHFFVFIISYCRYRCEDHCRIAFLMRSATFQYTHLAARLASKIMPRRNRHL